MSYYAAPLRGLGAAAPSYLAEVKSILAVASTDQDVRSGMDALSLATTDLYAIASGDAGTAVGATMSILQAVAPNLAAAATDLVGSMGEAIPIIGQMVGVAIKGIGVWADYFDGNSGQVRETRKKACFTHPDGVPAAVLGNDGTGVGKKIMPCDILVRRETTEWGSNYRCPTQGCADTEAMTKSIRARTGVAVVPTDACYALAALEDSVSSEALAAVRQKMGNPNIGIPKKDRELLRRLRLAIMNSWGDRTANQGIELWPTYMGLIYKQWRLGRMGKPLSLKEPATKNVDYLRWLWVYPEFYANCSGLSHVQKLNMGLLALSSYTAGNLFYINASCPGGCRAVNGSPLTAVAALVDGWESTVNPIGVQDRTAMLRSLQEAKKALLAKPPPPVSFPPATSSVGMHPAAKAALVAGVAIGGGLVLMKVLGK